MFSHLSRPRSAGAARRGNAPTERFAGVAAGPAEQPTATTRSGTYLGAVGDGFDVVARVAGTTPQREGDGPDVVRHCFRTVDDGLALCCPLPTTESLRLGSVVHVSGVVTGRRTQGINHVTEISAAQLEHLG